MRALPRLATAAALALPFLPAIGHAALVDVQFGGNFSYACPDGSSSCPNPPQSGAAYVGSAGDQWNYYTSASGATSLVNAAGALSGASITFSSDAPYSPYADGTNTNNFYGTPYANLFGGYLASTSQNGILITLSGLAAGQGFNLYTYSEQDGQNAAGRAMAVTVNGTTEDDTQTGAGTFVAGDTYLQFTGTADASGKITISISTLNGESDLNGLQLQTIDVPEPASAALLAGGIALAAVRRRRAIAAT